MRILRVVLYNLEGKCGVRRFNDTKRRIIIYSISVAAAVIFFVIFIFAYRVTEIEIIGNEICTNEEVKAAYFGGPLGNNTFVVWMKDKLDAFHEIPFIRDVDLTFEGQKKVTIEVYEKALVACFHYMGEYVFFDKDGVILETSDKEISGIPCIEGIAFQTFTLNEKISIEDESKISTILDISELVEHYNLEVNKVVFNNMGEVTLYCGEIKRSEERRVGKEC